MESMVKNNNDVEPSIYQYYAKRAAFGSTTHNVRGQLILPPSYDPYLCEWYNAEARNKSSLPIYHPPPYDTVMIAPRGHCTFERKAYAAKRAYGAKAVLIYDELAARYGFVDGNSTTTNNNEDNTDNEASSSSEQGQVIYPTSKWDYDCTMGSNILNESLPLDPPAYNGTVMDPLMDMTMTDTSICTLENNGESTCDSQLCLVISRLPNSTIYPVCCAWDVPITMPPADDAQDVNTDDIVAVFLTIRQGQSILNNMNMNGTLGGQQQKHQITIEARGTTFNISYLFMWVLGTFVVTFASWYAANEYRRFHIKLTTYKKRLEQQATAVTTTTSTLPNNVDGNNSRSKLIVEGLNNDDNRSPNTTTNHETPTVGDTNDLNPEHDTTTSHDVEGATTATKVQTQTSRKNHHQTTNNDEEMHSLYSIPPRRQKGKNNENDEDDTKPVFVLNFRRHRQNDADGHMRTTRGGENQEGRDNDESNLPELPPAVESSRMKSFEMNQWHVLIFIVTASLLLILLFFFQFYNVIFVIYGIGCGGAMSYLVFNPLVTWFFPKFGNGVVEKLNEKVIYGLNGFDIISQLTAYIWAAVWLWFGITTYRPETNAFFWITMDIFGICFCVLTVSLLKLNSIKIATILMVAIFIYDIFFVFITPFLTGGDSIMLTVAGGSGWSIGLEDYCYRYQNDRECTGISFLPMLLLLPRVNDYANRAVILGLGDIILPGFLLAFCARHDAASRLVGANMTNTGIDVPHKWYQGFFFPMIIAYTIGLLVAFMAVLAMEQGQPALLYIVPMCLGTIFFIGRHDLQNLWSGDRAIKMADRLIERHERSWAKARMKRYVEKKKRENNVSTAQEEPINDSHTTGNPTIEIDSHLQVEEALSMTGTPISPTENPPSFRKISKRNRSHSDVATDTNHHRTKSSKEHFHRAQEELRLQQRNGEGFRQVNQEPNQTPNGTTAPFHIESLDQPTQNDVCFGDRSHPGTIELQKAVKLAYDASEGAEFNPQIFKSIRKTMEGRNYYCRRTQSTDSSIDWRKASRMEIRDEMWKMYDDYRLYLAQQNGKH